MRAALLMLGSTMAFGLMAVAIRYATRYVPTRKWRSSATPSACLLLPMLLRPAVRPEDAAAATHFVRSAIGLGSMLCAFWALGHLPLAQAVSLSYSTPLFVTIAAVLWLGETVRVRRWAAVVVGFIGVLVIVRPGTAAPYSLVAVGAAVLSSLVAIQIKQLTRVDSADTVVLYTYVFWCRCRWCRRCSSGSGRPGRPGCGCWPPACSAPSASCCGPARGWARSLP